MGVAAIFVGCVVAVSLIIVWISIEILVWILIRYVEHDPILLESFRNINFYIIYFFVWEGLLSIGVSVLLTLFFSRRIVGPIYHIQKELKYFLEHRHLEGREIRVRQKDEFQEFTVTYTNYWGNRHSHHPSRPTGNNQYHQHQNNA